MCHTTRYRRASSESPKFVQFLRCAPGLVALAACSHAGAEQSVGLGATATLEPLEPQRVIVTGRSANLVGVADSATEGIVTGRELTAKPLLRSAEVLESVPGLTVTQHSGDGKANQYFLRGFNLDHGSDFATFVNDVPINNVSHAHGQGYTDLNFLIPELIGTLRYRKGSYDAADGVFAVTGAASIDYVRTLPISFADVTVGTHDYRRVLGAGSVTLSDDLTLLGAVESGGTNGPWEKPERLHKFNSVLRLSSGTASNGFSVTAMTYLSEWVATEEVPERAVKNGEIGRFGTLGPTDGGRTYRDSLSADWARTDDQAAEHANAYLVKYGLNLFSTPSGFLDGQHEQEDRRTISGGAVSHRWYLGPSWVNSEIAVGAQVREDQMPRIGLFRTENRQRSSIVRQDALDQWGAGAWLEAKTPWTSWARSTVGVRYDQASAHVRSVGGPLDAANGGFSRGSQVSPKIALAFCPFAGKTEFYVDWGVGYHVNDFRGATTTVSPNDGTPVDKVPPLAKAINKEIGVRSSPLPGWSTALSLWATSLASELVFDGDQGVTEPRGASRRYGAEWWNDYSLIGWLIASADLAVSRARFDVPSNGGTHVPNSIPLSASVGVSADKGGQWFGGARLRLLGAYPLEETGREKSTSFLTTNVKIGYRIAPHWSMALDVLNVFDKKANDIEYWGSSCTQSEASGCNGGNGVDGRLVHPMEPRTFRVSLRVTG